tara:strand:- start:1027 stop:1536 length:510 start_codon:yes stop_codon:yes gene_type:complete
MIQNTINTWTIKSSTDSTKEYVITYTDKEYTCECKGYQYTNNCKHIKEVKDYIKDNPKLYVSNNIIDTYGTWCLKCIPIGTHNKEILVSVDRYGRKEWHVWSPYYTSLIPRKVLSIQERKKLIKDIVDMEQRTWIEPHRLDTSYIDKMNDSELFIYNKSMVDMKVKNVQ